MLRDLVFSSVQACVDADHRRVRTGQVHQAHRSSNIDSRKGAASEIHRADTAGCARVVSERLDECAVWILASVENAEFMSRGIEAKWFWAGWVESPVDRSIAEGVESKPRLGGDV